MQTQLTLTQRIHDMSTLCSRGGVVVVMGSAQTRSRFAAQLVRSLAAVQSLTVAHLHTTAFNPSVYSDLTFTTRTHSGSHENIEDVATALIEHQEDAARAGRLLPSLFVADSLWYLEGSIKELVDRASELNVCFVIVTADLPDIRSGIESILKEVTQAQGTPVSGNRLILVETSGRRECSMFSINNWLPISEIFDKDVAFFMYQQGKAVNPTLQCALVWVSGSTGAHVQGKHTDQQRLVVPSDNLRLWYLPTVDDVTTTDVIVAPLGWFPQCVSSHTFQQNKWIQNRRHAAAVNEPSTFLFGTDDYLSDDDDV
jgi:hypothetical protein